MSGKQTCERCAELEYEIDQMKEHEFSCAVEEGDAIEKLRQLVAELKTMTNEESSGLDCGCRMYWQGRLCAALRRVGAPWYEESD